MKKIIAQLFLFLIPTLIVALIFIPLFQQNIFWDGEGDYDMGLAKIDAHVALFDAGNHNLAPVFFVIGEIFIFIFIVRENTKIALIKNHSPPGKNIA